jgi:hypothetical protein
MKCLKSSKTGNIIRVSDEQADRATSEWKFIPKLEWKAQVSLRLSLMTLILNYKLSPRILEKFFMRPTKEDNGDDFARYFKLLLNLLYKSKAY